MGYFLSSLRDFEFVAIREVRVSQIGRRDANVVTFVPNVAAFVSQQTRFDSNLVTFAANQMTFVSQQTTFAANVRGGLINPPRLFTNTRRLLINKPCLQRIKRRLIRIS